MVHRIERKPLVSKVITTKMVHFCMAPGCYGVKSILKLYLNKSIVTDGKTTRSKVESID